MNWSDASEITLGLILENRLSLNSVTPDLFMPPYDAIVRDLQKHNYPIETLIEKHGLSPIQICIDAVKSVNGLGEKNWIKILESSSIMYQAGAKLEKFADKLKRGQSVDWSEITYYASLAEQNKGNDFTPLNAIEAAEFPFIDTGWQPIDQHLGGIPKIGLVIVGGASHSGKTTFWVKLSSEFVKRHPEKNVVFFSLEMILEEIKARYEQIATLTKEEQARILVNPHPMKVEDIIAKASGVENIGLIGVDFADLLIQGETSESAMSHIYRTLAMGAKKLNVPIILLAQLSNYSGGIPRANMLRWTRLAEALAWMVLMVYNPAKDWFEEKEEDSKILPIQKNTAYVICWKCRGGFRKHPEDSPGAIMIPFRGDLGWGNKSRWFDLSKEV